MIHSVFRPTGQIKPTESARDALTSLILASLGNKAVATAFVQTALGKASPGHESILLEVGSKAAGRFASILRKQHLRDFARAYPSDFSIPSDEREALSSLEKRVDELQRKVREKTASVAEYKAARKQFEDELEAKAGKAVQLGLSDLKTALSYESVVIESGDIEDADSAEET